MNFNFTISIDSINDLDNTLENGYEQLAAQYEKVISVISAALECGNEFGSFTMCDVAKRLGFDRTCTSPKHAHSLYSYDSSYYTNFKREKVMSQGFISSVLRAMEKSGTLVSRKTGMVETIKLYQLVKKNA